MPAGGVCAAVVAAEVGDRLVARGAHYGACRVSGDGTRSVSWWWAGTRRRRERRLVFRALGGRLDEWEVEYAEVTAEGRGRTLVHGCRSIRTGRAGLAPAVTTLLDGGPPRSRRVQVVDDDAGAASTPSWDGDRPGPWAAAAAAAGHPRPRPSGGLRVANGLLGVLTAVVLLAACRIDIDLAPNIASFAVPLLGVSLVWVVLGLAGVHRDR